MRSSKLEIDVNTSSQFDLFSQHLEVVPKERVISNYELIIDGGKLINLVNTNAPVKIICKNKNESEISVFKFLKKCSVEAFFF